jgi:hypothetical protein
VTQPQLLESMKCVDANPLSQARLHMQVSMADMLGDEAIMTFEYAPQVARGGGPF